MSVFSENAKSIMLLQIIYRNNKFNKFPQKCKLYIIITWFTEGDIYNDNSNSFR